MIDCNEDVESNTMQEFTQTLGMREVIIEKYHARPPNMHKTGSKPIDGIFATKEVNILTGGYTDFFDCVQGAKQCNHWCLWIDILLSDIFGSKIPPIPKFAGQRVNNKNPRTAQKFNKIYKEYIYTHNLHKKYLI